MEDLNFKIFQKKINKITLNFNKSDLQKKYTL